MQDFHRKPADQDNGFLEELGLCFLIWRLSFCAPVSANFEHMCLAEDCYHMKKIDLGTLLIYVTWFWSCRLYLDQKKNVWKNIQKGMLLASVSGNMMNLPSVGDLQMKMFFFVFFFFKMFSILDRIEGPTKETAVWDSTRMFFYTGSD